MIVYLSCHLSCAVHSGFSNCCTFLIQFHLLFPLRFRSNRRSGETIETISCVRSLFWVSAGSFFCVSFLLFMLWASLPFPLGLLRSSPLLSLLLSFPFSFSLSFLSLLPSTSRLSLLPPLFHGPRFPCRASTTRCENKNFPMRLVGL